MWLAARVNPRALVIASGFTSVPDLGAQVYPFLPVRLISRFSYDSLGAIGSIKAPVLVAHSREDDIIPFAHGKALYDAAQEPKRFLEMRGADGGPPYMVRFDDGHETLLYPGADCELEHEHQSHA